MGRVRLFSAVVALAVAAVGLSGCMQAINPNAGYRFLSSGTLGGTYSGSLSYPRGTAVDSNHNIFVVDSGNDRIVELTYASGTWTWQASWPNSSTPATDIPYAPEGITVDTSGNLWIADSGNKRILYLKGGINPTAIGAFTSVKTSASISAYQLDYPTGLAIKGTTLYVTDPGSNFPYSTPRIFAIDISSITVGSSTLGSTTAGSTVAGFGSGAYQFSYPRGIAVDSSGNVYVADETNYRIDKMSSNLASGWTTLGTRGSGTGQFISPQTVAVDSTGHIYVVDSANYWIVKMNDISGSGWALYGAQTGSASSSVYPNWVAVDSNASPAKIYVSDDTMNQIAEFQ